LSSRLGVAHLRQIFRLFSSISSSIRNIENQ
jgi:hypothetical protein